MLHLPGFFLDKWLFEGHGKTFVFLVHLLMPILSINLFSCICNSLFNPFLQKISLSWLGSDFLAETGQTSDCLGSGETQWPIVQCWFWTLERTQHLYPGNCSQDLCMWDRPGTWDSAAVPAPGHSSLQATEYKETIWAKNNNIHGQLGQILDKRYKETKKTQVPVLKRLEQKQGNVSALCTQWHLEVVRLPRPSLRPYPHPR